MDRQPQSFYERTKGDAMRRKNAITKRTKQGDRPLAARAMAEKFTAFRFGRKHDPDALAAVHALHNALHLKSSSPSPVFEKQIFDEQRDIFWTFVAENYEQSWTKHDGTFFRRLADAMEVHQKPNDAAWTFVSGEIITRREHGLSIPTVSEMHRDLEQRGITATRKTVENIYREHGVSREAKRGRKAGTKQKSVHRIRR